MRRLGLLALLLISGALPIAVGGFAGEAVAQQSPPPQNPPEGPPPHQCEREKPIA